MDFAAVLPENLVDIILRSYRLIDWDASMNGTAWKKLIDEWCLKKKLSLATYSDTL